METGSTSPQGPSGTPDLPPGGATIEDLLFRTKSIALDEWIPT
jgi:hypothetical protein